jgi:hypothetical protein
MIWRSTAMILAAFLAAGLAIWFAPVMFDFPGLREFIWIGEPCLVILVLSVLEVLFARLPDQETGHHKPST